MRLAGGGREVAFGVAALAVCLAVFVPWLGFDYRLRPRASAVNDYWKAQVPDLVYGRAHRPYVQRVLVPTTIRWAANVLPSPARRALRRAVSGSPLYLPRKFDRLGWEAEYLTEYLLAILLVFGWLLVFPYALRGLFGALYAAPLAALGSPLLAVALLPALFFARGTHYLYDFAALSLFTLALAFLARRRYAAFYVVLVLGLLNKETTVLATLAFALTERRTLSRRRLLAHVGAQIALAGVIQSALRLAFRANPGAQAEWHLLENLQALREPPAPLALLLLGCIVALVLVRYSAKPSFLRRSLLACVPLLPSWLLFGIHGETRVFYEAYPILFLLAFDGGCAVLGSPLSVVGNDSSE